MNPEPKRSAAIIAGSIVYYTPLESIKYYMGDDGKAKCCFCDEKCND